MNTKFTLILCAFFTGYLSVGQTTRIVTNTDDAGNGTLRYHLGNSGHGDTITFDPTLISLGSDTLLLSTQLNINKGVFIKKALASGHAAASQSKDPVQQSFEMIFGHQGVSSAIVGTINPQHLKDNITRAKAALATSGC